MFIFTGILADGCFSQRVFHLGTVPDALGHLPRVSPQKEARREAGQTIAVTIFREVGPSLHRVQPHYAGATTDPPLGETSHGHVTIDFWLQISLE